MTGFPNWLPTIPRSQMLTSVSYSREDVNRTAPTSRDHSRARVSKDTFFRPTVSTAQVCIEIHEYVCMCVRVHMCVCVKVVFIGLEFNRLTHITVFHMM